MDKAGLVISTGPAPLSPILFEEVVRKALENAPMGWSSSPAPIECMFDGTPIPEFKVFPTESQKGN